MRVAVSDEFVSADGKVRLRPFRLSDVLRYVAWTREEQVRRYFASLVAAEDPWWWITLWFKPSSDILGIYASVGPKGEWRHIGGIGFQTVDPESNSAEFGFAIGREEWRNQGYGTAALHALMEYAFLQRNLDSLYARVISENQRSLRVLEKTGFECEQSLELGGKKVVQLRRYRPQYVTGSLIKEWPNHIASAI